MQQFTSNTLDSERQFRARELRPQDQALYIVTIISVGVRNRVRDVRIIFPSQSQQQMRSPDDTKSGEREREREERERERKIDERASRQFSRVQGTLRV